MEQRTLFTPGPLNTSATVKEAMQIDLGTRDTEYQMIVENMRKKLLTLAHCDDAYTVIFQQGSGTFGVESVLSTAIPKDDGVLIIANGAYGQRMAMICQRAGISYQIAAYDMTQSLPLTQVKEAVANSPYHYCAFVHCETTAGVLNDLAGLMHIMQAYHQCTIVDAMSSFGSMDIDIEGLGIDYLVTSANKCLHGVPGVSVIFARKQSLLSCQGQARSYSLDLYDQYVYMDGHPGSFRFTSPTHVLLALNQALQELDEAGGLQEREKIYRHRQQLIQDAMEEMGFQTLVSREDQSPVITTYLIPESMDFNDYYEAMKAKGYLLYSGKLPGIEAFRIGNIGEMEETNISGFLQATKIYLEGGSHEG